MSDLAYHVKPSSKGAGWDVVRVYNKTFNKETGAFESDVVGWHESPKDAAVQRMDLIRRHVTEA